MTINLKEIRVFDTDNIKLDKINYNFDQLIVNGGGPKGPIGSDGNIGAQGFQGALGFQGDRGAQGTQGPDADPGESFWEAVPQNFVPPADNMATLFAKHPDTGTIPIYPAVVGTGYVTGDNGYNAQQPNNGLPKYQWVVNRRRDKVVSNLRFTSEGVPDNAFDITMDNFVPAFQPLIYKLLFGFIDNQNSQLNFQAEQHIITSTDTGQPLLKVSNVGGEINVDTVFEAPVTFNQKLSIENSGADGNKIATAIDNTGEVTFKTASELGGSIKIGTIISILPSIFSDPTKFVYEQTIDTNSNPDVPIQIKMGAGIGDYIGWYVCNGQTWTDGTTSFSVPDLNSYSYQIIANPITSDPNSQGYVNYTNDGIHLIGGADIFVDVLQFGVSGPIYDASLTDNSNDPGIATNGAGNSFSIKKLPQIIYLGINNLYWSQLGTGQLAQADYSSTDYDPVDYFAF